ncbi:MAG: hypothetical protein OQL08_13015 [Gammaproteobacteria bacterium]|nr:hypothetical protein [Gammaproteobacteria bacterium]
MIAPATQRLGILARWYAEPLSRDEAESLLALSQRREQERLKRHGKAYLSPLLKLIALHWLGEATDGHYHYLRSQQANARHLQILTPLLYGQLLMSKRISGATDYLDEAFHQARLLLRPEDYFMLMKRHQILKRIPLSDRATPGETLELLLTTGKVIARMEEGRGERPGFWHDPNDTYG